MSRHTILLPICPLLPPRAPRSLRPAAPPFAQHGVPTCWWCFCRAARRRGCASRGRRGKSFLRLLASAFPPPSVPLACPCVCVSLSLSLSLCVFDRSVPTWKPLRPGPFPPTKPHRWPHRCAKGPKAYNRPSSRASCRTLAAGGGGHHVLHQDQHWRRLCPRQGLPLLTAVYPCAAGRSGALGAPWRVPETGWRHLMWWLWGPVGAGRPVLLLAWQVCRG